VVNPNLMARLDKLLGGPRANAAEPPGHQNSHRRVSRKESGWWIVDRGSWVEGGGRRDERRPNNTPFTIHHPRSTPHFGKVDWTPQDSGGAAEPIGPKKPV